MPFVGRISGGSILTVTIVAAPGNPSNCVTFIHWDTAKGAPLWPPINAAPGVTVVEQVLIPPATQAGSVEINVDLPPAGSAVDVTLAFTLPVAGSVTQKIVVDTDYTFVIA